MPEHHSIIIIGAGLSGLYAAWQLHEQNDVILLEAQSRIGGRILSPKIGEQKNSNIDLGPAWCWPQLQPRLQRLSQKLNLKTFNQYTHGDMLYEISPDNIQRYGGQSSHNQSFRFIGGCESIINALSNDINESIIHTNTQVVSIDQNSNRIKAISHGEEKHYSADQIILALPLRILEQNINFTPALNANLIQQCKDTPTWMAGHCKIIFSYDNPFWRDQNLSGEVFSRYGPMSEIYDGSPENEEVFALTSFVGLSAQQRLQIKSEQLITACKAQLLRLFGEDSQNIKDIVVKDWSVDNHTSTELDISTPAHHPQLSENTSRSLANGNIVLAGTETAIEHGGYLEGALESAELALSLLGKNQSITLD